MEQHENSEPAAQQPSVPAPEVVLLSPAARAVSVAVIWALTVLLVVLVGVLVPAHDLADALGLALAAAVIVALVVQLGTRQKNGYVMRLAASATGAAVIVAVGAILIALLPR